MLTMSQTLFEMLYRCYFWNKPKRCYHYVDFADEDIEAREVKKAAQRHRPSRWKIQVQTWEI